MRSLIFLITVLISHYSIIGPFLLHLGAGLETGLSYSCSDDD